MRIERGRLGRIYCHSGSRMLVRYKDGTGPIFSSQTRVPSQQTASLLLFASRALKPAKGAVGCADEGEGEGYQCQKSLCSGDLVPSRAESRIVQFDDLRQWICRIAERGLDCHVARQLDRGRRMVKEEMMRRDLRYRGHL